MNVKPLVIITLIVGLGACAGDETDLSGDTSDPPPQETLDDPETNPDTDEPIDETEEAPDEEDPTQDDPDEPAPDLQPPEITELRATPFPAVIGEETTLEWAITSETPTSCALDVDGDNQFDYEFDDCLATTSLEHVFAEAGDFGVKLVASNEDGDSEYVLELPVITPPLVVTSTADSGPGSLRATVEQAVVGDTITFDLPPQSVIELQNQIILSKDLTICGQGPRDTVLDGLGLTRAFGLQPGITVTICDLSIRNGMSELFDSGYDTKKAQPGGAIYAEGEDDAPIHLTLRNIVIRDSQAYTEEPNRTFDSGGCVYHEDGTLTVESSTFENCFASSGGAISSHGEVQITDSVFRNNESLNPGGALQIIGTADIRRSSFIDNTAGTGGGAMIIEMRADRRPGPRGDGSSAIVNSTFFGNHTPAGGGAVFSYTSTTVINSTFFDNSASQSDDDFVPTYGGAIYQHADTNRDDYTLVLRNSIIYGNTSPEGPDIKGEFVSEGVNLVGSLADAVVMGTSDPLAANPMIAGLADYNGAPPVLEINSGSPAIDAVPTGECLDWDGTQLTVDQRGESRPAGASCDAGAFERQ